MDASLAQILSELYRLTAQARQLEATVAELQKRLKELEGGQTQDRDKDKGKKQERKVA